jgi:HEAT repeat protein
MEALAQALDDPDSDVRFSAGITLFIAGTAARDIIPHLINALDQDDVRVCRLAAACLSNLGAAAHTAVPRLQQLQQATDSSLRSWVAEAISKIEGDT